MEKQMSLGMAQSMSTSIYTNLTVVCICSKFFIYYSCSM